MWMQLQWNWSFHKEDAFVAVIGKEVADIAVLA